MAVEAFESGQARPKEEGAAALERRAPPKRYGGFGLLSELVGKGSEITRL